MRKAYAVLCLTTVAMMACRSAFSDNPAVVALEWLPKYAHKKTLKEIEKTSALVTMNCMGDESELRKNLEQIKAKPPALVIAFSDAIAKSVASECSSTPLLAVMVDDPSCVMGIQRAAPVSLITSQPDAVLAWRVMREARANIKTAGMLYTKGISVNEKLFGRLSEEAKRDGASLERVLVDAGFCRTDADFVSAVDNAIEKKHCEVLFLPDDPNGSRFGATIFHAASAHGVPSVGTDATDGKGCVAALCVDYEKMAELVSSISSALIKKSSDAPTVVEAPNKVTRR
jgi:ABC-type uncharacterized transport system substrate-binding protein